MVVSRILDGFYVIYGIPKNVTFKYLKSLAKANGFELKRPTKLQLLQGGDVNVIESLLQIITLFVAHLLYEKTLLAAARQKPQEKVILHHSPSPVHLLLLDSLASPSPSGKSQVSPVSPAPEPASGPAFTSLLPFPLAVATEESEDEGEGDEDGESAADATILKTLVGSVVQVVNTATATADQENINPGNPGLRRREDAVESLRKRAEPEISRVAVMIARLEDDKRRLEERQRLEIQQGSGSRSRTLLGGGGRRRGQRKR